MLESVKRSIRNTRVFRLLAPWLFRARNLVFDVVHSVDTARSLGLEHAEVSSASSGWGNQYEGVDARLFRSLFRGIAIAHEKFVFVDLGSGKGKALLLASEFPFKRITGVEFSPVLHRIAEANIRRYRSFSRRCATVESVCMDALGYRLPTDPTVFFLYNSFRGAVLEAVLANIQRSLETEPREMLLVYVNPELDHVLESTRALTKIKSGRWYTIYAAGPDLASLRASV